MSDRSTNNLSSILSLSMHVLLVGLDHETWAGEEPGRWRTKQNTYHCGLAEIRCSPSIAGLSLDQTTIVTNRDHQQQGPLASSSCPQRSNTPCIASQTSALYHAYRPMRRTKMEQPVTYDHLPNSMSWHGVAFLGASRHPFSNRPLQCPYSYAAPRVLCMVTCTLAA